jgi:hypothetical protein
MRERLPGDVIINKRRYSAQTPQCEPHETEFGRIHKIYRHDLFGLNGIILLQPCRILQYGIVRLFIRPLLVLVNEEGVIRLFGEGMFFEAVEKVQSVSFLTTQDVDLGFEEGTDESVVVPKGESSIEVGPRCRSGWGSES